MSSSKFDVPSPPLHDGLSLPSARLRETFASCPDHESTDAASVAPFEAMAESTPRALRASKFSPLLTIEQLADLLAVSPKTVRRLVARGFPHIRLGRVLRFDPADVSRWLTARKVR
jgi:excisionase family DNA binding protein